MTFINELFKEIKIRGHLEDLRKLKTVERRATKLNEIVINVNISKNELSFYSPDEQLFLFYKIQENKIDMGLCPHFYIFFSNKNQRFHHVCKLLDNQRTKCRGRINKCDKIATEKK